MVQFMNVFDTLALSATIKQHNRKIFVDLWRQLMKVLGMAALNVTRKQHNRKVFHDMWH